MNSVYEEVDIPLLVAFRVLRVSGALAVVVDEDRAGRASDTSLGASLRVADAAPVNGASCELSDTLIAVATKKRSPLQTALPPSITDVIMLEQDKKCNMPASKFQKS